MSELIWDIAVEETPSSYGKCIHASESMFREVAGILFKLAGEKPDKRLSSDLNRDLIENFDFQARLFAFATQLLTGNICDDGGEDVPVYHRQKSSDPYVLQELQGGDWIDVFDYRLILGTMQAAIEGIAGNASATTAPGIVDSLNGIWTEFETVYTGTSGSVDGELVITGPGADIARNALCLTLKGIIRDYAKAGATYKQDEADNLNRASLAIGIGVGIIGIAAAVLAIPTFGASLAFIAPAATIIGSLTLSGAVLGMTSAGLQAWSQHIKDTDLLVFQDPAAISELACLWFDALKTEEDISDTEYTTEIDVSGASANTQALYASCKDLIEQPMSYVTFLKGWKLNIQYGNAGIVEDCGCAPESFLVNATDLLPNGRNSGIDVVAGSSYAIGSTGTWDGGSGVYDGKGSVGETNPVCILPAANIYSLIARVGTSGGWHYIGDSTVFVPSSSGRLYFIMNDGNDNAYYVDNSGSLTVTVTPL